MIWCDLDSTQTMTADEEEDCRAIKTSRSGPPDMRKKPGLADGTGKTSHSKL